MCLHWVRSTEGSPLDTVNFVSDEAREKWSAFITQVRLLSGQPVEDAHRSPQFLVAFVDEQRRRIADLLGDFPDNTQQRSSTQTYPAASALVRALPEFGQ